MSPLLLSSRITLLWLGISVFVYHLYHLSCTLATHTVMSSHPPTRVLSPCGWEQCSVLLMLWLSSVQSLSRVRLFVTPWIAARQASLSILNSWSLLKLMSIEPVMPSNHLILCHPLLLPPSIFPSTRVFSSEWVLRIRWPNYGSFSFSISPSNEYSGLISFRMNRLDLAVQGTLKSLLQHNSSKAAVLWCSTFFMVQLSHPYMLRLWKCTSLLIWAI